MHSSIEVTTQDFPGLRVPAAFSVSSHKFSPVSVESYSVSVCLSKCGGKRMASVQFLRGQPSAVSFVCFALYFLRQGLSL